ncbi:hypothetical protein TTRE_0000161001 [Trichuris trichiura]|uniref:Uncharacterized protein n=1 Tax=Trichuris trichiura TaxID=36087 RepID=A0A077YZX2_TRITR|nr:hypothetical protein TTRE_0000161001 [Trichuris trichiura]
MQALYSPEAQCQMYKRFYPETKIERIFVDRKYIPWGQRYKGYKPPRYTAPCDNDEDSCDPPFPGGLVFNAVYNGVDRSSYVVRKYKVKRGFPRNPLGRTGIAGRGSLQRWGPNHLVMVVIRK